MDPQEEDEPVKTKWISCPPMAHTPAENAGERNFCGVEGIGQKQNALDCPPHAEPCPTFVQYRNIVS